MEKHKMEKYLGSHEAVQKYLKECKSLHCNDCGCNFLRLRKVACPMCKSKNVREKIEVDITFDKNALTK